MNLLLSHPDLPPGYTYPAMSMGYRSGPSPQDVRLAEPADLEAVQVEPTDHAPQSLSSLEEELDCQATVRPLPEPLPPKEMEQGVEERVAEGVVELRQDVEVAAVTGANYVSGEKEVRDQGPTEEEVLVCPPAESPVCEAASCPVPLSTEEPERPAAVITLEEEEDDEAVGEESQVEPAQKVTVPGEQDTPAIIELDPASPAAPAAPETLQSSGLQAEAQDAMQRNNETGCADTSADFACLSPASTSVHSPGQAMAASSHKPLVPCYWSLELLIAAAFCTDVPPFPLLSMSAPSAAPAQSNPHQGMELLSELADLELQQQKRTCGKSQGEGLRVSHHLYIHTHMHTHPPNFPRIVQPSFSSVCPPRQTPTLPSGLACVATCFLPGTPLFLSRKPLVDSNTSPEKPPAFSLAIPPLWCVKGIFPFF